MKKLKNVPDVKLQLLFARRNIIFSLITDALPIPHKALGKITAVETLCGDVRKKKGDLLYLQIADHRLIPKYFHLSYASEIQK